MTTSTIHSLIRHNSCDPTELVQTLAALDGCIDYAQAARKLDLCPAALGVRVRALAERVGCAVAAKRDGVWGLTEVGQGLVDELEKAKETR